MARGSWPSYSADMLAVDNEGGLGGTFLYLDEGRVRSEFKFEECLFGDWVKGVTVPMM